jgi:hypothetical protein
MLTAVNAESAARGSAPARWLAASAGVAAAVVLLLELLDRNHRYDRVHLPAFDGHVYAAMAELPGFFTVAPWGYRVLAPWLAWALPGDAVNGFALLTPVALAAAGVALFLFLRRIGNGEWAALAGMAVFLLSPPVRGILRYRFLAEPVTVLLEACFLLALQAGAPLGVLVVVGLLGVLSKEFFVVLFPLVYLHRRRRGASRRAALAWTAMAGLPAVLLLFLLPRFWTPHLAGAAALPSLATVAGRFATAWPQALPAALLAGLTPLALLGALRRRSRPVLVPALYLILAAFVAPFFNPASFSAADLPRLQVYALPAVIALALAAVDRVIPHLSPPSDVGAAPTTVAPVALIASALVFAGPFLAVDRYRRIDLRGEPDAAQVLAVCRGTLATAARLQHGQTVGLEAVRPALEGRRRWFLGPEWAVEGRAAVLAGGRGTVLMPLFTTADLEVTIDAEGFLAGARVNGTPLATPAAGIPLRLPRALLFRGDNQLEIEAAPGAPFRLRGIAIRPSLPAATRPGVPAVE